MVEAKRLKQFFINFCLSRRNHQAIPDLNLQPVMITRHQGGTVNQAESWPPVVRTFYAPQTPKQAFSDRIDSHGYGGHLFKSFSHLLDKQRNNDIGNISRVFSCSSSSIIGFKLQSKAESPIKVAQLICCLIPTRPYNLNLLQVY